MIHLADHQIRWYVLLAAASLIALLVGGRSEKGAALVLLVATGVSNVLVPRQMVGPQWQMILTNGLVATAMIAICLASRRWWPIFAAAWAALSVSMYLTVFVEPLARSRVYYSLSVFWDYLQLAAIGLGALIELLLPRLLRRR